MKPPPPMPELCGSTTLRASNVAIAASAALPPRRSISTPAAAARGSAALTIPGWGVGWVAEVAAHPLTARAAAANARIVKRIGSPLLAPHRLGNASKAFTSQPTGQAARDAAGNPWPFVDHGGVELDKAGAGTNPGPGIVGTGDPADPDQRDFAAAGLAELP